MRMNSSVLQSSMCLSISFSSAHWFCWDHSELVCELVSPDLDCKVLIPLPVLQRIVGTPSSGMVVLFPLVLCVQVEKPSKASTSSLELTWSCRGTHRPPLTTTPGSSPSEGQLSRWTWRASLSTTRSEYVQQRHPIRVHNAVMMASLITNYLQQVKEVSCCSIDVWFH